MSRKSVGRKQNHIVRREGRSYQLRAWEMDNSMSPPEVDTVVFFNGLTIKPGDTKSTEQRRQRKKTTVKCFSTDSRAEDQHTEGRSRKDRTTKEQARQKGRKPTRQQ